MNTIKLGDLVIYKTHAYAWNINPIKISANALFTPPIMIVDQISYTDLDKKDISKVRCRFYNSNTNKIEENWFHYDELLIFNSKAEKSFDSAYEQYGLYTLKSCIDELKKLKAVFQIENSQQKSSSTSFLNHLPPVFILIGKAPLITKGNLRLKEFCNTGYKVKWFSPDSGKFKEDILPEIVLTKIKKPEDISFIELAIKDKIIYKYQLVKPFNIQNTDKVFTHSLFRITDVRFNHISVILKIYDILLNLETEISLEEFYEIADLKGSLYSDYFIEKYPKLVGQTFKMPHDIAVKTGVIYNILYLNAQGEKTNRCIVPLKFINDSNESEDGQLMEAFCLLRREIRYFWTKRIISIKESNYKLF